MKPTKKLLEEIDILNRDPYRYLEKVDIKMIIKIIKYAKYKYFNEEAILEDSVYDLLIDYIERYGNKNEKEILQEIGEIVKINKHKLPFIMGSMNKIKITDLKKLDNWLNLMKGPYLISDKLDGISSLLIYKNNEAKYLYTRGNGLVGSDITHLLRYIKKVPRKIESKEIIVRGEIIMNTKIFNNKYSTKNANARNLVSGIINSKKLNKDIISDIDFIAYEIINPWYDFKTQFDILKKLNFILPNYEIINELNMKILSDLLKHHRRNSDYEIDGIIITDTKFHKRYTSDNPNYSFAFKETLEEQIIKVKVLDVEWNISKDGYIKPKLILEPTKLSGVIIKNVTAFNAKFIKDNNLGPGSIIKITRSGDVIPNIIKSEDGIYGIIKSTKAKMPEGNWKWTKSGVDIMTLKKNDRQKIKEITYFLKKLNIKYIDEKIVEKLYNIGYTNINKYILFNSKDLNNIIGFKDKLINKLNNEITQGINNMTLLNLMIGSNIFGHGIGEKKIKKILDIYPDILLKYYLISKDELYNMIMRVEGYNKITTDQFIGNLKKFNEFFFNLPKKNRNKLLIETIVYNKFSKITTTDLKLKDKQFVFSNFRNKEWEEYIINRGGKIMSSISKNTDYLITTKDQLDNPTNNKVIKANKLNIKIIIDDEFKNILKN